MITRHCSDPRRGLPWALLAAALGLMTPARAAETGWMVTLDPAATEIRFSLGATLHDVHGGVKLERGELRLNPRTGALDGEVVVDARSAETGNERRDRDMHRKVLESESHPRFVFVPSRLDGDLALSGRSRVVIHGELRIHGAAHALVMPADVTIEDGSLTATAAFAVPYVEWGMKDPSKLMLRVKKRVEIEVTVGGTLRERIE